jgi:RNA polymerase sigma-70 factor (ECF subfamily)
LFERYGRHVYARARVLLGARDLAEDAKQEIFLRLLAQEDEVLQHPAPHAWLHRVTTNHCLNWLRDEKRRKVLLDHEPRPQPTAGPALERRVIVRELWRRVPRELQEIAVYYHLDDLTREEIAERLHLSRRTVGNRLLTLRATLDSIAASEPGRSASPPRRPRPRTTGSGERGVRSARTTRSPDI